MQESGFGVVEFDGDGLFLGLGESGAWREFDDG